MFISSTLLLGMKSRIPLLKANANSSPRRQMLAQSVMRKRGRPRKTKTVPDTLPDFDKIVERYARPRVFRSRYSQEMITQVCGAQAIYHDLQRMYLVYYTPYLTPSTLLHQHGLAFLYAQYRCLPPIDIVCLHVGIISEKRKDIDECDLVFDDNTLIKGNVVIINL